MRVLGNASRVATGYAEADPTIAAEHADFAEVEELLSACICEATGAGASVHVYGPPEPNVAHAGRSERGQLSELGPGWHASTPEVHVLLAAIMSPTRIVPRLAFLASTALAVSCIGTRDSLPPIAELVSEFPARRAVLDTLRQMSNHDPHVDRIAPDFTGLDTDIDWPRPDSLLGFSQARWDEYRRLFKRVGSESELGRDPDGRLFITIKAVGLSLGGASVGYVWCPTPPAPLVTSLDALPPRKGERYQALAGGWYLFKEMS